MRGDAALPFKDIVRNYDSFTQSVIWSLVQFNRKFNPDEAPEGDYDVIARGATSLIAKEVRGAQIDMLSQTLTPEERDHVDERKFVEAGDGLRGKSLLLFRRAFGDQQKPADGVPLFRQLGEAPIPDVLQVDSTPSEFERGIWARFWELASDPDLARSQGIAVVQGEAPHIKPVVGQVYKLTLRAAGGLDIQPRLPAAVLGSR